jgi:hypothetical protein
VYNKSNSAIPDNNVYFIAFDHEGTIWIGTESGGLVAYRPRPIVDFNGNGVVDLKDLIRVSDSWGQDDPVADIAPEPLGDGIVDALDLELLMSYWGQDINDSTLITHWALDEAKGMIVSDSVGSNIGYAVGDPVWHSAGGQVGGALELDGIDDFISAPAVIKPSDGPFSVFVWIKGGVPGQGIISESGGPIWLYLDPQTGYLMTDLTEAGRLGGPLLSQANIADGSWHRIGFIWDGLYRTLCVDDVIVAQDTQNGLQSSGNSIYIGCGDPLQSSTFFSGMIDDVRIYNRPVSP